MQKMVQIVVESWCWELGTDTIFPALLSNISGREQYTGKDKKRVSRHETFPVAEEQKRP